MAEIKINTSSMKQYASRIGTVNARVVRLNNRIKDLYTKVGLVGLYNLIQADALTGYSWRLSRAQSYLNQTALDFESVENQLNCLDPTHFNLSAAVLTDIINQYKDKTLTPVDIFTAAQRILRNTKKSVETSSSESVWDKFWDGDLKEKLEGSVLGVLWNDDESFLKFLTGSLSASLSPGYGKYEKDNAFNQDINDFLESKGKSPLPKQQKKEGVGKQINKDEEFYDKTGTIFETKAEAKAEGSVLDGKLSGDSEYANGSLEGKLLTAQAYANAAGGFYVYEKDKDGNTKRIFSPGVSAEVGASASVFEGKADGRIGLGEDKNMLGLYGDGELKALTAEAKAKVAVNKNEIFAGASAEADLVKVTASGGVSVLGADVGLTGSLKVGAGAHANVGYTDGKLKVDVGAAVGIGFDVGFEVDIGGTVDAVCDGATAVWNGVKGFFSG